MRKNEQGYFGSPDFDHGERVDTTWTPQPESTKGPNPERKWIGFGTLALIMAIPLGMLLSGYVDSLSDGWKVGVFLVLFVPGPGVTGLWLIDKRPKSWIPVLVLAWVVFILAAVIWAIRSAG